MITLNLLLIDPLGRKEITTHPDFESLMKHVQKSESKVFSFSVWSEVVDSPILEDLTQLTTQENEEHI